MRKYNVTVPENGHGNLQELRCPEAGDIVWLNFTLQAGHEQAGHRPALVRCFD
jgi:hypothetical protein